MPALPETPMISCICPFPIMSGFVERARNCYKAQTYQEREWVELLNVPHTRSVGKLRNECLEVTKGDYIAHFDYDDWSAPDRLAIQRAHIESTGKLVSGFYSCALYDSVNDETWIYCHEDQHYSVGAGLFYKRAAWEREKFPDQTPEDVKWLNRIGADRLSRSGFREDGSPIMIQVIHGRNASARIFKNSPRYKVAHPALHHRVREILSNA